ncbi:MAG TPA: GGDEF domain-containing protein [Terracidiphilus sp.]|jgi:diguanylate cyclase (GGDEF)-like protein
MISLKKYLDTKHEAQSVLGAVEIAEEETLSTALDVYGSALREMGNCSLKACPGVGDELMQHLGELAGSLSVEMGGAALAATGADAREQLQAWAKRTAKHYQHKAGEVKELLTAMVRATESVGARDERYAGYIHAVTSDLRQIATLEDVTAIRASIEKSAAELKTSIDRMTAEGKAVIEQLRKQVSYCQAKLEEAEAIASRDALTGVRSRLNVESHIQTRINSGAPFCVAILDIDGFKKVNDEFGHLIGDELLKQFARELRSVCRSTDIIGRWGGDEFILLLDCSLAEAVPQRERLRDWVCGHYTVEGKEGATRLNLNISIGLAEHASGEPMMDLLARADDAMYAEKGISRSGVEVSSR